MEVLDPERGTLERDSNNLADLVCLGIHPDVAEEQTLFLTLWNDVQHVLRDRSRVFLAQEDKVIIGSGHIALAARLGRSYFLFQDVVDNIFTSRITMLFGDVECFDVRGSEIDLSSYFSERLWIVAPE